MVSNYPITNGQIDLFDSADGANPTTVLVPGVPNIRSGGFLSATRVFTIGATTRVVYIYDTDGTLFGQSLPLGTAGSAFYAVRSPDSTKIAVATSGSNNSGVYIVDATDLTVLQSYVAGSATTNMVDWRGNTIVISSGSDVLRFDATNLGSGPTTIGSMTGTIATVALSPDGQFVAAGSPSGLRIFKVSDGSTVADFPAYGDVRIIKYYPDGSKIATGLGNGQIRVIQNPVGAALGSTVFLQGPNSGPLPRLVVGWRTSGTNITLPTVVIDIPIGSWDVRAIGAVDTSNRDGIIWQNTDPGFAQPGLVAAWSIANNGVPTAEGVLGAPPSFAWVLRGYADINGSGRPDLIFHNTSTNAIAVWLRDAAGNVIGTPIIGTAPSGWTPRVAALFPGSDVKLFFQNNSTSEVAMWSIDSSATVVNTTLVGTPGSGWEIAGLGTFSGGTSAALLFQNNSNPAMSFWNVSPAGVITETGTLSEDRPAGWNIVGVGRL
jgi:hypothetical protein